MPRINKIEHARGEYKCSKCGKEIHKGDPYLKSTPFHKASIIRCPECGIQSWETSTSEYVLTMGNIANNWESDYGLDESTVDNIKSNLEEWRDQCQDSYDTIPENLQYGPNAELLQERIDNLEEVIGELDNIDWDSIKDELEYDCDYEYREENGIDEEAELSDEQQGELNDKLDGQVEAELRDRIEEALSLLSY